MGKNGAEGQRGFVAVAGNVKNCYTTAEVQGTSSLGGLLGHNAVGDILNSYYLLSQDSPIVDNGFGQALTDSQMKSQQFFIEWDFENVWTICEDQDYPHLRWENAPCP